ncbi:alpha/beta fold hydrolase [Aliiglaciecola sp. CAU 1673]|uniref:lipase family alpha/beta hydrolase n=1 Tax=Aliiglaciecola sp. CAU 1673 TaxID=3032595 RepID=UPI0023DC29C2|nr:alpha/beta fold hydrolase [Aliiglaciecola sp. CAU 1673]MDF2178857.1 alpha/beta fold hydrolase [Aliiglaciecola sp. CAU 1673]
MLTIFVVLFSLLLLSVLFYSGLILIMYWRAKVYHRLSRKAYAILSLFRLFALVGQIFSAVGQLIWWQLTKTKALPGCPKGSEKRPLVLCVHGFHMNGNCFYGMRRYLEAQGYATYAVNLGRPYISPKRYVQRLQEALLQGAHSAENGKVHIIAHSMGGLICRMLLKDHPESQHNIASIITLGTPHKGTAAVGEYALPWLKTLFHPDSRHLAELPSFAEIAPNLPTLTLASEHDFVVYPTDHALLADSSQLCLQYVSHVGMLTLAQIYTLLNQELKRFETMRRVVERSDTGYGEDSNPLKEKLLS